MLNSVSDSRLISCTLAVFLLAVGTSATAAADTWVSVSPDGTVRLEDRNAAQPPEIVVHADDETRLDLSIFMPGFTATAEPMGTGDFVRLHCPDTPVDGDPGTPALPVVRRLIGVPQGATVDLLVGDGSRSIISLAELDQGSAVFPMQGSLSTDPRSLGIVAPEDRYWAPFIAMLLPFHHHRAAYTEDAFWPVEPVTISPAGVVRGMDLYLLEARPIAYNPARGELEVTPRLDVSLQFRGTRYGDAGVLPTAPLNRVVLNPPRLVGSRTGENLLIIAAELFTGSAPLTQFINAKTTQGYVVNLYTPTTGMTRDDIKAYIQSLWGTPDTPDYVLIVGDALYETGDVGVESIPVWMGGGTKAAATDIPYVCMDVGDDWMPDIPIGRIPVRLVSELQDIVDKILTVELGTGPDPTYAQRAAFMAGPDPAADSETRLDQIISGFMDPRGYQSHRLYVTSYGADTEDLANAFNAGCFLGVYFGHADGVQAWWSPAFYFQDIEALTNTGMYPFVVSFSCSCAAFHYMMGTGSPGFLEKWMLEPDKAAAAAYGTTTNLTPYTWDSWGYLNKNLFKCIYDSGIEELAAACQASAGLLVDFYGTGDPVSRDHTESFLYLGDPTMRFPEEPPATYLIVAASDYVGQTPLNQLIAAREARGFNVTTYSVPAGTSRATIKSYIDSLWGTAYAPDYVVIIGDTDGTSSATSSTIPHWIGTGSKGAATDWPYVCFDGTGDWYPEIPIGRLSVRDNNTLQDIVDKILTVESGNFPDPNYVLRGAFLANPSTYGQAEPTHDWVIDNCLTPNGYTGIKLYASQGADTQDVANALNAGALFAVYFGHSSDGGWWDPSFYQSDVSSLTNTNMYPIVAGWSCNTAHYSYSECVGETWLREANKGAAAYISASDYIYWGSVADWQPSVELEKAFFRSIFVDEKWEVGPAWLGGLYRFLKTYGGWSGDPNDPPAQYEAECHNFFEEFVILGDPALLIPRPDGFTVEAAPTSEDVCSPPIDEVTFTISVGLLGSFSEPVTLNVSGAPAGATVNFNINGVAPPYTSILTLGNLIAANPGQFNVLVTGTSASQQHGTAVQLTIADGVPGVPTLTSPPDGAVGITRQPTLAWLEASGAYGYDVQIATDVGFSNVVYSAVEPTAIHAVSTYLDEMTEYFWRVRAYNGCGNGTYSAASSFTTLDQASYFTEEFTGSSDAFDFENTTLMFTPDGSGSFYDMCAVPATVFPVDPTGGTSHYISEDGSATISVPDGDQIWLYGVAYTTVYANDNGNLTFGSSDSTWTESLTQHFSRPRIAPLFNDFSVANGTVSSRALADQIVVTYEDVPQYNNNDSNNFQVQLFFNGDIHITWLGIDANDGIAGLSAGSGVPSDYLEMDLSATPSCYVYGACCLGEICLIRMEDNCIAQGGTYQGDDTTCDPDPCIEYNSHCLMITEVVQGAASGNCPRWIEITNTGSADFAFFEGGLIVQSDDSNDVVIDVDLSGVVIAPGQSFVINSNSKGTCTGAFPAIYGFAADLYADAPFCLGNDTLILTDTADASNIIDCYGEFGVDGTGKAWEFTSGYAYRRPEWHAAAGTGFPLDAWYFGGVGSLTGDNPTQLLLDLTTPGSHVVDETCTRLGDLDGDYNVGFSDFDLLSGCVNGPDTSVTPQCTDGDLDGDGDADTGDLQVFQIIYMVP